MIVSVVVRVTNTGKSSGDEVVQLYGIDNAASIVRPQKLLIGFKRVTFAPGKSKTVQLTFRLDQLAFPNADGGWVIEKDAFTFEIAKDANTLIYTYAFEQAATVRIDHTRRGFFADAAVIE